MIRGRHSSRTRFVVDRSFGLQSHGRLIRRVLCGFLFILACHASTPAVFGQSKSGTGQYSRISSSFPGIQRPASDHYTVIGLRVEFQPDSSRYSTGDGTFGGTLFEGTAPPTFDALPHDARYFEAHLSFLSNYIRKVSDGHTSLSTHVLPKSVRVSKKMAAYAPIGFDADSDAETSKLADFAREAWTLAESDPEIRLPVGLDPERTAFVLFHAGVGRDIELLGNTLDKTPEDLPSLFFDTAALERLTGTDLVVFDGIPVSNTAIIPRTETRRGNDVLRDEPFLIELTINGLLAASFLNYLGVPDLFNTSSGESAIGPFGVMDGLGIFAFSGLIPPEPSAWTKLFLGWADVQLPGGESEEIISLIQTGDTLRSDVFVAPVSDAEYFLVENRNRDPEGDGVRLTVYSDGSYNQVVFENGASDFNRQNVSGFPGGVVVDVDNFDFVLPGGKDENGELLNGGILIWHVDERRLRQGMSDNSVNADSSRRSISLVEADGAPDIGFPNASFLGPAYNEGSPFDFYYEGNPYSVLTATGQEISLYENRFGPDTFPSSAANEGGPSFVELREFSPARPEMEFVYTRIVESGIEERLADRVESAFGDHFKGASGIVRYVDESVIDFMGFAVDSAGRGALFYSRTGEVMGSVTDLLAARPAVRNGSIYALSEEGFWTVTPTGESYLLAHFPATLNVIRALSPVVAMTDGSLFVAVETSTGPGLLSLVDGVFSEERVDESIQSLAVADGIRLVVVYGDHAEIRSTNSNWTFAPLPDGVRTQAAFVRDSNGLSGVVTDVVSRSLFVLHADGGVSTINMNDYELYGISGTINPDPVMIDLDGDRLSEIVTTVGTWLLAFRSSGTLLDSFPIRMRVPAVGQPVIGVLSGGSGWTALISSKDGQIDAYDLAFRGQRVAGFPLSVGAAGFAPPVVRDGLLAGLSSDGSLSVWHSDRFGVPIWPDAFGPGNESFFTLEDPIDESGTGDTRSNDLLPSDKTYNWPNPITEGVTRIRVEPSFDSDVQITIVSTSGVLIETFEMMGIPGGIASEVEWRTDAASGVYIARVTATSGSRVETRLIKMAVIR